MFDFIDNLFDMLTPIFIFFADWWFLIIPPAYFESCYFSGRACARIMKNKGYPEDNSWFVFGAFFNVIGVFICKRMKDYNTQPDPFLQQLQGVYCRHCGAVNEIGTIYCRNCGNKVN